MQTIITTAGMPPRDAFEYWYDVACAKIIKHEAKPLDRTNFHAELTGGALADLWVFNFKLAPVTVWSSGDGDDLFLVLSSSCLVEASEDRFEADSKSLLLLDGREKSLTRHLGCQLSNIVSVSVEQMSMRIPRTALTQRIPVGKEVINRPLPIRGDTGLLARFIRMIVKSGPSTLSPQLRLTVRDHALDLVASMVGNLIGATPQLDSPRQIMLRKVRAVIENQLRNPAADRASIVAATGFSERHLNRLLAQEGTSITELLRKRRLAKCREAIEQSNRSINDIANEFSFETTNFARDFKREFGLTPREARLLIQNTNRHGGARMSHTDDK
jgi:AraC-like DNA-binding protein